MDLRWLVDMVDVSSSSALRFQEKGAQFDGVLWKKNLIHRLKEHRQIYSTDLVTLCDYQGHVCVFGSESRWNGTEPD